MSIGKVSQAEWKSVRQIERLRAENKCLRCERQGCYARICPLLPVGGVAHEKDVPRPDKPLVNQNGRPLRAKWKTPDHKKNYKWNVAVIDASA